MRSRSELGYSCLGSLQFRGSPWRPGKQQAISYSIQLPGLVLPLRRALFRASRSPPEKGRSQPAGQTGSVRLSSPLWPCQLCHLFPKPRSLWSPAHVLIPAIPAPPAHPCHQFQLHHSIHSASLPVPVTSIVVSSITLHQPSFLQSRPLPHHHRVHHSVPRQPMRPSSTSLFPSPSSPLALLLWPLTPSSPSPPPSLSVSPVLFPQHHLSPIMCGSLLCPHPPISLVHSTVPSSPTNIHSITPSSLHHFCSPSPHSFLTPFSLSRQASSLTPSPPTTLSTLFLPL